MQYLGLSKGGNLVVTELIDSSLISGYLHRVVIYVMRICYAQFTCMLHAVWCTLRSSTLQWFPASGFTRGSGVTNHPPILWVFNKKNNMMV